MSLRSLPLNLLPRLPRLPLWVYRPMERREPHPLKLRRHLLLEDRRLRLRRKRDRLSRIVWEDHPLDPQMLRVLRAAANWAKLQEDNRLAPWLEHLRLTSPQTYRLLLRP